MPVETKLSFEEPKRRKVKKAAGGKKKAQDGEEDLSAVPQHIMRIVQGVDEKRKRAEEAGPGGGADSISVLRKATKINIAGDSPNFHPSDSEPSMLTVAL